MTNNNNILPPNIKSILAKYYEGLTSIEEERTLREYFGGNQIPDSNIAEKTLFAFTNDENLEIIPNNEIWDNIRKAERKEVEWKRNIRWISSIAASILLVISITVGYNYHNSKQRQFATDTFKNPDEAYKAVQKYLGLVSNKLSYAYTGMKPIEKLAIPGETMQSFSTIDDNLLKLRQLDLLNSSAREIEHFSIISDFFDVDKN